MTDRLKWLVTFGVLMAAFAYHPAQADDFWLQIAPPPPKLETTPVPRVNRVWSPGYYAWNGRGHSWRSGHWKEARPGYTWIADHWMYDSNAWLFRTGHWEPDALGRS